MTIRRVKIVAGLGTIFDSTPFQFLSLTVVVRSLTIIFSVCLKNTYLLSATGSIVPVESAAMRSTLLKTRSSKT